MKFVCQFSLRLVLKVWPVGKFNHNIPPDDWNCSFALHGIFAFYKWFITSRFHFFAELNSCDWYTCMGSCWKELYWNRRLATFSLLNFKTFESWYFNSWNDCCKGTIHWTSVEGLKHCVYSLVIHVVTLLNIVKLNFMIWSLERILQPFMIRFIHGRIWR